MLQAICHLLSPRKVARTPLQALAMSSSLVLTALLSFMCATQAFVVPASSALNVRSALRTDASALRNQLSISAFRSNRISVRMCADSSVEDDEKVDAVKPPKVPVTETEMLELCSKSIRAAFKDGKTRQKIRLLMPRDGGLIATDEDWPGGIMQLFNIASPLTRNLLRRLNDAAPKLQEQRLDESGVDGISLWMAQYSAAKDDVSAFVQPNTEVIDSVSQVCKSAGPRLVLIMNPQWRETADGYDLLGSKEGLLGQIGNFLGGTAGARKEIQDLGFEDTYLIQQYVVRGDDCQIIKAFPYPNWVVYTTTDDGKKVMLGEQASRPTYQDIEALLEEKGVSAKWAREAGLGKAFKE